MFQTNFLNVKIARVRLPLLDSWLRSVRREVFDLDVSDKVGRDKLPRILEFLYQRINENIVWNTSNAIQFGIPGEV